jgi:hypothetical protein
LKCKLFLTVLLLAAIATIGVVWWCRQSESARTNKAAKAELERIYKLPIEAQSLAGVKGIWVGIHLCGEEAKSAGLTEEQLKEDVESKLQLAGIKVNSEEEWSGSEDRAFLGVTVYTVGHEEGPSIAYAVDIQFAQRVKLVGSPFAAVTGSTWGSHSLGISGMRDLPDMIEMGIITCGVDRFISDYLTANPKK